MTSSSLYGIKQKSGAGVKSHDGGHSDDVACLSYGSFAADCIAIGHLRWAEARSGRGVSDSSFTDFTVPGSWLKTTTQGPGS